MDNSIESYSVVDIFSKKGVHLAETAIKGSIHSVILANDEVIYVLSSYWTAKMEPKWELHLQISIGQSQGWTTVLGEKFNWETIGESARSLSNLISSLVLAIGYFDDEVLEIFIYQNGEILDRYAGGDVLEEYEMEPETFDYAAVVERLGLTVLPDSLGVMFQNDDVREIVEQLETVVPAPLILKYDWIEDDESLCREFVHVHRSIF
ncbi:hypothetical protein D3C75_446880 [compost metagenome]